MPKKNRFSNITPVKTLNPIVNKKKSPDNPKIHPNKKRNNKNSIMWLQEAYDISHGETALWVAVITQAMMDSLSRCQKSESIYHKNEAIRWLTSNGKDFLYVCMSAGMDPDYVRRKAKKVLAAPVPWRAEAGKGKRYLERKEYRKKQRLKEDHQNPVEDDLPKVIYIY